MDHKIHILKTWPKFFSAIMLGKKNFEVRKNDRDFHTGDIVELHEWNPETGQYTGRLLFFTIGFIVDSEFGLQDGYCAFALLKRE